MKNFFLVVAMTLIANLSQAAAPISEIQSMLDKPQVLCGRFDQVKKLSGMKKPLSSNGRFCVVTGKGVLWRTLHPFPDTLKLTKDEIIHYQGDRVAMRLDANQEPTVRTINSVLFSLLSGDLSQLETLFDVEGNTDKKAWRVTLRAKQPALAKVIGAITLKGDSRVQSVHFDEASGDTTDIVFSAMQTGEAAMLPEEAALF
ncbi:LolA family protein [Oxalicibacterium solurbis]|uniref:Outer membrane lipoprotein carrier protein LolA n=1 Tax=Oxalicibacterium solurbis TaxID=69280 RepID=A0A8J3AW34_9BURK|nr:outer membrane lipoprotein carrier protein LolA [Oxalicibacterium solurbis]GGI54290.1 hypothetical protein GCM10011430_14640 [Oxalicibacterium solurbis]